MRRFWYFSLSRGVSDVVSIMLFLEKKSINVYINQFVLASCVPLRQTLEEKIEVGKIEDTTGYVMDGATTKES